MTVLVDEDAKEQIQTLFEGGYSLREIGEEVGVSKQVVWYHVQKMELEPPDDIEREEQLELLDLLLEGMEESPSLATVAEELEVPVSRARSLLQEKGAYSPHVPFKERVGRDRLIQLYVVEDRSLAEIQEALDGVSPSTLSKTLKEFGVPIRPRGTAAPTSELRQQWRQQAMATLGLV